MEDLKKVTLSGLYIAACPIGSVRDITLRTLDILHSVDIIAAEDTQSARRLLTAHGISLIGRRLISYNDGNGAKQRPFLLSALESGKSVCLICEAGSPLIADPGLKLTREAANAGHRVHVAPGPSAVIAALTVSGLPTDCFMFVGFLPTHKNARTERLKELSTVSATLVFFESPRRLADSLNAIRNQMGEDRQVAVCRELTKKFEEVWKGTAIDLAKRAAHSALKGEIVILVDHKKVHQTAAALIEEELRTSLNLMSVRDAVEAVAKAHCVSRKEVYKVALDIVREKPTKLEA